MIGWHNAGTRTRVPQPILASPGKIVTHIDFLLPSQISGGNPSSSVSVAHQFRVTLKGNCCAAHPKKAENPSTAISSRLGYGFLRSTAPRDGRARMIRTFQKSACGVMMARRALANPRARHANSAKLPIKRYAPLLWDSRAMPPPYPRTIEDVDDAEEAELDRQIRGFPGVPRQAPMTSRAVNRGPQS